MPPDIPAPAITLIDTGLQPYEEVLQLQEVLFEKNLQAKELQQPATQHLILCEHYPVYTLGKSGKRENILVSDEELNAQYFHVNRGGDVTFHGPGQLVAYPILDVDALGFGLAEYIWRLEDTIIQSIAHYQLNGERITGAAGIWLRKANGVDVKIAAIGVKASRHVTMHGLALNLNTDLSYFQKIVPCGLVGKGVTSLQQETGKPVDTSAFKKIFLHEFARVFGVSIHEQSR